MKSKLFTIVTLLCITLSFSQTTFTASGLNYEVTSTTPNEVTLTGSTTAITSLDIPETVSDGVESFTVVAIANNAFESAGLTSVSFPSTLRFIGSQAFKGNTIASFLLPNSLTTIGTAAFQSNTIAGDLVIPNSVTSIGNQAFENNQIAILGISDNLRNLGNNTFRLNMLTSVTIPAGVTSMGSRTFGDNPLTAVEALGAVPATIFENSFGYRSTIDLTVPTDTEAAYATASWTGFATINGQDEALFNQFEVANITYRITSVSLKEVETVDTSLTGDVVIPDSVINNGDTFTVKAIGGSSFRDKQLTSVVIPNTVISIDGSAFRDNNLTHITLPNSILSIGPDSFSENNINTIIFSDNITTIAPSAFQFNNLSTLTIPAHITNLDSKAFNNNPLNRVVVEGTTPPSIVNGSGPNDSLSTEANIDLFIPVGTSQAYTNATWIGFKSVTEASKALNLKVFLQGASLNPNTGEENLMRDDLRVAGLIPSTSPYADGITITSDGAPAANINDDCVDWVFVELRDANDSSIVIEGKSGFIQRDGDIVSSDGFSLFEFTSQPADYFIAIKHRNHLGVIIENATKLSSVYTSLDFTKLDAPITFGTYAQTDFGMPANTLGMWAGNVNGDAAIQYIGGTPDSTSLLETVLNSTANFLNFSTFIINGYTNDDIDMNGSAQYEGASADAPLILQNVLANPANFLKFSTFVITEQLPKKFN